MYVGLFKLRFEILQCNILRFDSVMHSYEKYSIFETDFVDKKC